MFGISEKNINKVITLVLVLFLCLALVLTVKIVTRITRVVWLHGDTSADLALAYHLSQTNQIMAKDWYYGSEPHIVHTQLIFAPLFHLFSDWAAVRVTGTLILQGLLILSFAYMMKQAGQSIQRILLGSALLILPYSIYYGRIVLYFVSYITYITSSFLMIGFLFSYINACEQHKKIKKVLMFILIIAFAFVTSLQGYRPMITFIIPAFLSVFLALFRISLRHHSEETALKEIKRYHSWIIAVTVMTFSGGAGVLTYAFYIRKIYSCMDFAGIKTQFISPENFIEFFHIMLKQFGYRDRIPVNTIVGLLSLASIFVALFLLTASFSTIFPKEEDDNNDIRVYVLRSMMLMGFLCLLFVNFYTNDMLTEHYILPASTWMIPLFCSFFNDNYTIRSPKKWLYYLALIVFAANGLVNSAIFLERPEFSDYSIMNDKNKHSQNLAKTADYLLDNGYDYGFADHWIATVVTEMTDGIPLSAIDIYGDGPRWLNILTSESIRHKDYKKAFILVPYAEAEFLISLNLPGGLSMAHKDNESGYCILDISDLDAFRNYLNEKPSDYNTKIELEN